VVVHLRKSVIHPGIFIIISKSQSARIWIPSSFNTSSATSNKPNPLVSFFFAHFVGASGFGESLKMNITEIKTPSDLPQNDSLNQSTEQQLK